MGFPLNFPMGLLKFLSTDFVNNGGRFSGFQSFRQIDSLQLCWWKMKVTTFHETALSFWLLHFGGVCLWLVRSACLVVKGLVYDLCVLSEGLTAVWTLGLDWPDHRQGPCSSTRPYLTLKINHFPLPGHRRSQSCPTTSCSCSVGPRSSPCLLAPKAKVGRRESAKN